MKHCTLCNSGQTKTLLIDNDPRTYFMCSDCDLIFVDPKFYLNAEESKNRYKNHRNSVKDEGYVNFLNKAIVPALPFLSNQMKGLDYGCGPGPTLHVLLERKGILCDIYDPIFYKKLPKDNYDFIFSTECFEHFYQPSEDLKKIGSLLNSKGILIIMTSLWTNPEDFSNWYYKKDLTHVSFYKISTFHRICEMFGYQMLYCDNISVMILKKK